MDLREKAALLGAFGSGLALGISGLFYLYKTNRKLGKNLSTLRNSIDELKQEIHELKLASQSNTPALRSPDICDARLLSFNQTESQVGSETQTTSTEEEEFFDFSESDEVSPITVWSNAIIPNEENAPEEAFEEWINSCDMLLEDSTYNKQLLYEEIKRGRDKFGERAEIMWRLAKATHLLSIAMEKEEGKERRKEIANETLKYAKIALQKDEKNSNCHKWYAIAIGALSDYVPTKEKILNGYEFRQHVETALKISPNDPTLHHMLGRWCTEIASLTWIEKKVASTLFSQVPDSNYEIALKSLMKAHEYNPKWKENILCICKALLSLKRYEEAAKWIGDGLQLEIEGESDQLSHEKLLKLKEKYGK